MYLQNTIYPLSINVEISQVGPQLCISQLQDQIYKLIKYLKFTYIYVQYVHLHTHIAKSSASIKSIWLKIPSNIPLLCTILK